MPPSDSHYDHAGNLLRWCARLIRSFAENGVNRAYISPGSRSTPLTFAAASCPLITSEMVLDERSAGFRALGSAKATGLPALLICTSGTAAANYYPAVIEARQSGTPLIVCSADRTPLERNTGANQTIDQLNLFGNYPVFFHDAGEPGDQTEDFDRVAYLAKQAVEQSVNKHGPVHLNFPFRKPLEPASADLDALNEFYSDLSPKVPGFYSGGTRIPEWLKSRISNAENPVAVCGPLADHDPMAANIRSLADKTGVAVWTESTSLHISGSNAFSAASQWVKNMPVKPDLILRFGGLPTSRGMISFLQNQKDVPHVVIRSDAHPSELPGITNERFECQGLIDWGELPDFRQSEIRIASGQSFDTYRAQWPEWLTGELAFTDLHAIDLVMQQQHATLMLSNSLIVRDVDRVPVTTSPEKVISNRGASGIDGITSTALGVADAADQTTLITGDLAFLHDISALHSVHTGNRNLHIVIINNGGGRIFRMLPFDCYDERFRELFETPQSTDIATICRGFGVDFQQITKRSELQNRLDNLPDTGIRITECVTDGLKSDRLRKSMN